MKIRGILLEHDVVNTQDVDRYCEQVSQLVTYPEAKHWFLKNLRKYLLNADLSFVRILDITGTNDNTPNWAIKKLQDGYPVHIFDMTHPDFTETFEQVIEDIAHFFEGLLRVANMTALEDEQLDQVQLNDRSTSAYIITKLKTMTFDQVIEQKDHWSKLIGKRSSGASKSGGKHILSMPNGYYAFQYSANKSGMDTMHADGNDLQNCLRYGHYDSQVMRGEYIIMSIRTAADEAVVGLRFGMSPDKSRIATCLECKGKNNEIPVSKYRHYVIALLNHLAQTDNFKSATGDLRLTGIFYQNGKFGDFKDVAQQFEIAPGFIGYLTEDMLKGTIAGEEVISVVFSGFNHFEYDEKLSNEQICAFLNYCEASLGIHPSVTNLDTKRGILSVKQGDGSTRYVDFFKDAEVKTFDDVRVYYKLDNTKTGVMFFQNKKDSDGFVNVEMGVFLLTRNNFIAMATVHGLITADVMNFFGLDIGSNEQIISAFKKIGLMKDSSGKFATIDKIYEKTKLPGLYKKPGYKEWAYLINANPLKKANHFEYITVSGKRIKIQDEKYDTAGLIAPAVKFLISETPELKFAGNHDNVNILNISGRTIVTVDQLLEILRSNNEDAPYLHTLINHDDKSELHNIGRIKKFIETSPKITKTQLSEFIRLLIPLASGPAFRIAKEKTFEHYRYEYTKALIVLPTIAIMSANLQGLLNEEKSKLFELRIETLYERIRKQLERLIKTNKNTEYNLEQSIEKARYSYLNSINDLFRTSQQSIDSKKITARENGKNDTDIPIGKRFASYFGKDEI